MNSDTELLQKLARRRIDDCMDRVETKRIDVELGDPLQGVLDEVVAYLVAVGSVKIEGFAPICFVYISEIRAKIGQIISFGTEVVVNNIERHCNSVLMTSVHKPLERVWASVRFLDCKRIHAVVSPVSTPRKLRHGHNFDCSYA